MYEYCRRSCLGIGSILVFRHNWIKILGHNVLGRRRISPSLARSPVQRVPDKREFEEIFVLVDGCDPICFVAPRISPFQLSERVKALGSLTVEFLEGVVACGTAMAIFELLGLVAKLEKMAQPGGGADLEKKLHTS